MATSTHSTLKHIPLAFVFLLLACLNIAHAVSLENGAGESCFETNNLVDPHTHKYSSDCDDKTFCLNRTCTPRLCRRHEFPFGYRKYDELPPLCVYGTFCPDEGSGCKPLVPPGSPCQINRDDQCSPPPNWAQLANDMNNNGSICLQSICR